ncbi:hypothetical protein CIG23_25470 [Raoultella planticola]|nr:hypothetical protein CIG23_25470 [Raoultella planticola]
MRLSSAQIDPRILPREAVLTDDIAFILLIIMNLYGAGGVITVRLPAVTAHLLKGLLVRTVILFLRSLNGLESVQVGVN